MLLEFLKIMYVLGLIILTGWMSDKHTELTGMNHLRLDGWPEIILIAGLTCRVGGVVSNDADNDSPGHGTITPIL